MGRCTRRERKQGNEPIATSDRDDACGSHPAGPSERNTSIGRRGLMKLAAGAGAAAIGVAGRGLILPWFDFGRAAAAEELIEPEVRTSRDGLLDTTLTCRVMPVPVAGQTAIMSVYEGALPGPTLRIRPGDRLRINLVNKLDDLPPGLPQDSPFLCSPMTPTGHAFPSTRRRATPTSTCTGCTSPPPTTPTTSSSPSRPATVSSTTTRPAQPTGWSLLVSPAPARHGDQPGVRGIGGSHHRRGRHRRPARHRRRPRAIAGPPGNAALPRRRQRAEHRERAGATHRWPGPAEEVLALGQWPAATRR